MSGSCHSSYIVVNMKLLQIAISKVTHCQEFGLELSLGQDLHQCEVIGAYFKLFAGSTKCTYANFDGTGKKTILHH